MNIKLKKIEIESFRAYKDKQLFDFTNKKGNAANLVVIFAPNGFGKTSLLDAIEWGLNKEINRFSNNEVLKKVTKLEKGIILKNRDSDKPNGSVMFIDDSDESLLLNTNIRGRINKTDYNEGIEIDSSSKLNFVRNSGLAKDNILSHDKIDSFLLFSSSKDRYEALAKFWDYSNDTDNYKAIHQLYYQIKKEIGEKNKSLKRLTIDIKDIYIPIDDINLYINKINQLIEGINIRSFTPTFRQSDFEYLVKEIITHKSKVITELREIQNNILITDQLYSLLGEYKSNLRESLELDYELKNIQTKINQFAAREKLSIKEKIISEEYQDINSSLEMIKTIKEKAVIFKQAKDKITTIDHAVVENNKKINELIRVNHQILPRKLSVESDYEKSKKTNDIYLEENEKINQQSHLYKKFIGNQIKLDRRLIRLKKIVNSRSENVENTKNKIIDLIHLLNLEFDLIIDHNFENSIYKEIISSLKEYKSKIKFLEDQKKKKKQEYVRFGKLSDDLNKIIKIGRQVMQTSESSACPLCSTSFPNFEELLSQVDRNIDDVFRLEDINKEIKSLDKDIQNQEERCEELFIKLKEKIKTQLKKIQETDKIEHQKLQRINLMYEKISNQRIELFVHLTEIKSYFLRYNQEFGKEKIDKDVQIIKNRLLKLINMEKELIIQNEKKLKGFDEELNKNKSLVLDYERKNFEHEEEKKNIMLNIDYITVSSYLDKLKISFEKNLVIEKETVLTTQHHNIYDEIKKIRLDCKEIEENLKNEDLNDLQRILVDTKIKREKCNENVISYSKKYNSYLKSEVIEKEAIINLLNKLKKEQDTKKELISYFDLLSEKLQYTNEVFEESSKIKEKNQIITRLKRLNEVQLNLNEILQESQQLIIKKINKAFNLEAINRIYGRIEPHPELKFMEIVPTFIDDKPSLDIYAPMNKERKDNPVLFFSSAQLDILSLSIFLAKALMEQDPVFNTIFMDDPVHHMDSINVLSFIDLLRTLTSELDRQIIITTHNEGLFKLIEQKIDPNYCNSKFIQLDAQGKVGNDNN